MTHTGHAEDDRPLPQRLAEVARQRTVLDTDVSAQRIARVYAEALLRAAEKLGAADAIQEELESLVHEVFPADPQFEAFLASGIISQKRKREVIQTVFGGRASAVFLKFLHVLNNNDRLGLLRLILAAYLRLRDEHARRIRVRVTTAVPLTDDQRARLLRDLREAFALEPLLDERVDPELLGGMVVRVGDWLYDASVRTRIETIRNQLIARSSHAIQSQRNRFGD